MRVEPSRMRSAPLWQRPHRAPSPRLPCEDMRAGKRVPIRHGICQHRGLGLLGLQNNEKWTAVYKLPCLRCSVTAEQPKTCCVRVKANRHFLMKVSLHSIHADPFPQLLIHMNQSFVLREVTFWRKGLQWANSITKRKICKVRPAGSCVLGERC